MGELEGRINTPENEKNDKSNDKNEVWDVLRGLKHT
jgi:hypothetical protein